jgi:hypothetical protein
MATVHFPFLTVIQERSVLGLHATTLQHLLDEFTDCTYYETTTVPVSWPDFKMVWKPATASSIDTSYCIYTATL